MYCMETFFLFLLYTLSCNDSVKMDNKSMCIDNFDPFSVEIMVTNRLPGRAQKSILKNERELSLSAIKWNENTRKRRLKVILAVLYFCRKSFWEICFVGLKKENHWLGEDNTMLCLAAHDILHELHKTPQHQGAHVEQEECKGIECVLGSATEFM